MPPKRLVYTFEFVGMPGHLTVETVTFEEEHGDKTKLTSKSSFQTVEDRDDDAQSPDGGREGSENDPFPSSPRTMAMFLDDA